MFHQILILFALSVASVGVLRRLQLPPLLGYVFTGLILGPHVCGVLPKSEELAFVADFGVVFLLFTIGLELSLSKLLAMRRSLLKLGGLQVLLSVIAAWGVAYLFGLPLSTGFTIAGALALSSTAIVIKLLVEQDELHLPHGKMALSILLFQDLAAIPFLVIVPALATDASGAALTYSLGMAMLKAAGVIILLLFLGRRFLRPIYQHVASVRSTELFMLTTLLVVLVSAWSTEVFGLSMALGGFLAGAVLAETEFVHQIENDIEPFRDIFLGLFFVTVGMLLNPSIVVTEWAWIIGLVSALVIGKALIVVIFATLTGETLKNSIRTGLVLAQGGEFGFALLTLANEKNILTDDINQLVMASIIISMVVAPFIIRNNRFLARWFTQKQKNPEEPAESELFELSEDLEKHVILCGFGRVGQTLGWFLETEGIPFIGLELDPKRLLEATAAKEPVYYGDSSDITILQRAGIERARLLIVCFDDHTRALRMLKAIRTHGYKLPILVRARDDRYLESLLAAGATEVVPELMEASLMLASNMLILLGDQPAKVQQQILDIQKNRYQMLRGFYAGEVTDSVEEPGTDSDTLHAIELEESAWAIGKTIPEIQATGVSLNIAGFCRDGFKSLAPSSETRLKAGDVLVLCGKKSRLYWCEEKLLRG